MTIVQSILMFIIVFGVLVFIHELGHYLFAKRAGILVREFAIGFGPKLMSIRKGETAYTLRMLPLGGYVMMAGYEEDDDIRSGMFVSVELNPQNEITHIDTTQEVQLNNALPLEVQDFDLVDELYLVGRVQGQEELERFKVAETALVTQENGVAVQIAPWNRRFNHAKVGDKMLTNFAGPLNNFILAIILFMALAFIQGGTPPTFNSSPIIGDILPNSPAQTAQIQPGDKIVAIDGEAVDTIEAVSDTISKHPNEPIMLDVQRDVGRQTLEVTPEQVEAPNGETIGQIGIVYARENGFLAKVSFGFTQTWDVIKQLVGAFAGLFTGRLGVDQLGGPVAVFQVTDSVVQTSGFIGLLSLAAGLSANLGFVNLIPIPGLDGGKLLLNIVELLRGKPISEEKEMMITMVGALFLIGLMIVVTWNDIQNFF
ncbi:RIP metalloprotease RseP [Dolosigranulum savutiense]|uniref:Zinc metalloprotease n=1 Tax=Dolosigranulum savutiense TaxID=3110288 RepID=A0AB74TSD9_9LACT